MTLLNNILTWTEAKLPLWQRDAVRRLFQKEDELSSEDYAELYTLLKVAHGLPNPLGLVPKPLKAAHLPTELLEGETVILKSIRDLKHVNCIAPEQILSFAPSGMSVVYGGNGSGKSGYTRVMKKVCRTRGQEETVHPNANDPNADLHTPEASFEIDINGATKTVSWISNGDSPDELATIAVFDSHCARAYLTTEQDVAYLPYGLDIIENLANKVLPNLESDLDAEIAGINIDLQPFNHLLGDTEVGKLISTFSESTDVAKIKSLGTLSEGETKKFEYLDKALAEADPSAKAKELRLAADRFKELLRRIESAQAWVNDDAITHIKSINEDTIAAEKAEMQAAETLQSGELLLPGTGEQTWKTFFEAARKFSIEDAYPEHDFPYTAEEAVCPLCQQSISGAAERLKRFDKYIRDDVAKTAAEKRQNLTTERSKIQGADLSLGLDDALAEELSSLDGKVISYAIAFQSSIENRRSWLLDALVSQVWTPVTSLQSNPRQTIRDLTAMQLKSSRTFRRAADETRSAALKVERDELKARQNLSYCLASVLDLIENKKKRQTLETCRKDLKTKPISDKSKEFASSAVTAALKDALDMEFEALGIGHIKTKLKERNVKGKIKHKLLLDLPARNKLEEILSKGEQRAIALGSFLAELELANHSGAIVFDDPVSSLDHKRRGRLAKRLAQESLRRQVLVFTHEVVFLHQLQDESEKLGMNPSLCFLENVGSYSGNVSPGLPWAHKNYKERIDSLEKAQKRFEKLPWPAEPPEKLVREIIQQYSFLRATIERVVQDFVLNATVQRFRDYIDVKRLELVVGLEKAEVEEIFRLNKRCHDLVEAHDPSSAKDDPPPNPEEFKQDIEDLKRVINLIKDRRLLSGQ